MSKTVWVVGQSDDHIDAVFSSEADARARYELRGGERHHWWYEEYELDPDVAAVSDDPLRGLGGLGARTPHV